MNLFLVTVRTFVGSKRFVVLGLSASDIYSHAADAQGDTVFGITVVPA